MFYTIRIEELFLLIKKTGDKKSLTLQQGSFYII